MYIYLAHLNLFEVSKKTNNKTNYFKRSNNMVNFKIKFSFCLFTFLLNLVLSSCRSPFSRIERVYIIDALTNIFKLLTVHCQSKDDDLRYKKLYPGEEFHFSSKEFFLEVHFSFVIFDGMTKI